MSITSGSIAIKRSRSLIGEFNREDPSKKRHGFNQSISHRIFDQTKPSIVLNASSIDDRITHGPSTSTAHLQTLSPNHPSKDIEELLELLTDELVFTDFEQIPADREFRMLKCESHSSESLVLDPQWSKLNRHSEVIPFERNCFKVTDPDAKKISPYINASVLKTGHILTQGPMSNTIFDFWWMVFDSKAEVIVNTTDCSEKSGDKLIEKCAQYWPSVGENLCHGDLSISLISEKQESDRIIHRKMKLRRGEEERVISQIHLIHWKDGDSFNVKEIEKAISLARSLQTTNAPKIVHCTAGIGRSGTFVCCDVIDRIFPYLGEKKINFKRLVTYFRMERIGVVATRSQYSMIHKFYNNLKKRSLGEFHTLATRSQLDNAILSFTPEPKEIERIRRMSRSHSDPQLYLDHSCKKDAELLSHLGANGKA